MYQGTSGAPLAQQMQQKYKEHTMGMLHDDERINGIYDDQNKAVTAIVVALGQLKSATYKYREDASKQVLHPADAIDYTAIAFELAKTVTDESDAPWMALSLKTRQAYKRRTGADVWADILVAEQITEQGLTEKTEAYMKRDDDVATDM